MSGDDSVNREFILDVIKLIAGILIFLIISLMLQSWELGREQLLGTATPGAEAYILIPIVVGAMTFAAVILFEGLWTVGGTILTRARESQT